MLQPPTPAPGAFSWKTPRRSSSACYNGYDERNAQRLVVSSSSMSSDRIFLEGLVYARSRDAAKAFGLSTDYVSRLARAGAIDGRLLANQWFVSIESLQAYVAVRRRGHRRQRVGENETNGQKRLAGNP